MQRTCLDTFMANGSDHLTENQIRTQNNQQNNQKKGKEEKQNLIELCTKN